MSKLDDDITAILERNARVEAEKAWEVSFTRRAFLTLFTYVTASLLFWSIGTPLPFLNALIPTVAYALSTLSLPPLKQWWTERQTARRT